jgi:hypothetical protein
LLNQYWIFEEVRLLHFSDEKVADLIGSALILLGTVNGATLRGDAVLRAARKNLAALILYLNGAVQPGLDEQLDTIEPLTDPSTLQ